VTQLIERAHREGIVRPDLTVQDFQLVLAATATPRNPALGPEQTLVEVRRLAGILLQGIRAHPVPGCSLAPLPS